MDPWIVMRGDQELTEQPEQPDQPERLWKVE